MGRSGGGGFDRGCEEGKGGDWEGVDCVGGRSSLRLSMGFKEGANASLSERVASFEPNWLS